MKHCEKDLTTGPYLERGRGISQRMQKVSRSRKKKDTFYHPVESPERSAAPPSP